MIVDFFVDPVLRGPTLGSMLMCLASSLIGIFVVLKRRSLVGEALSHCSYPGVVISATAAHAFLPDSEYCLSFALLIGAFITALLGTIIIQILEQRFTVKNDPALCFALSFFFAVGLLIASYLQSVQPLLYKKIQIYFFGQAATMMDWHIFLYGFLSLSIVCFIIFFFRHLQITCFDPAFASTVGIASTKLEIAAFFLLVLAVVIGIRSVGVVLMAGMLIAPAIAARAWTDRFPTLFVISGSIGILSGFLGNYLSIMIPKNQYSLPTGPTILLTSITLCIFSLLLAPKHGLCSRAVRAGRFRMHCKIENSLKSLWKGSSFQLPFWVKTYLLHKNFLKKNQAGGYRLTTAGTIQAERIIRLHRLWEVYLVDYLGQQAEKVHRNAEELEHLFTPELEKELEVLLHYPSHDPHQQPIPLPPERKS